MTRRQLFLILFVYVIGAAASVAWGISTQTEPLWSNDSNAAALLGFLLWSSFFGFCNAVAWLTWWSREHWLG